MTVKQLKEFLSDKEDDAPVVVSGYLGMGWADPYIGLREMALNYKPHASYGNKHVLTLALHPQELEGYDVKKCVTISNFRF